MSDLLDGVGAPVAWYGLLNSADWVTTEYALGAGAGERNEHGQTFERRLILKSGATLALTGADLVLQRIERRYVVVQRPGFMPERRKTTIAKVAGVGKWTLRGLALAHYARVAIQNKRVGDDLRNKGAK